MVFGDNNGNSTTTTGTNGDDDKDDDYGITEECWLDSKHEINYRVVPPEDGPGLRKSADQRWKMELQYTGTFNCRCAESIKSLVDQGEFNPDCDINKDNVSPATSDGFRKITFYQTKHCGPCGSDPASSPDVSFYLSHMKCKCKNFVVQCNYVCEDLMAALGNSVGGGAGTKPPSSYHVAKRLSEECGCTYKDYPQGCPNPSVGNCEYRDVDMPPGSHCAECILGKLLSDSVDTGAIALIIESLNINSFICRNDFIKVLCHSICHKPKCPEDPESYCPDFSMIGFEKLD